ncbi:Rv0361 family membrane protein [Patulibacter sp. S7RM1-6]
MRRRLLIGLLGAVAAAAAVLAVLSWRTDDHDRVRATVERFAAAVQDRDYDGICRDLLAPSLRSSLDAIDLPCAQALRIGFASVRDPRLTITNVTVVDASATAAVRTTAAGQAPSDDVLALRKDGDAWRITALGAPTTAPTPAGPTTVTAPGAATIPAPASTTDVAPPSTATGGVTVPEGTGSLVPDTKNLPKDPEGGELTPGQRRAMEAQGARGGD